MILLTARSLSGETKSSSSLPEFIKKENSEYINEINKKKNEADRSRSLIGLELLSSLLEEIWELHDPPILERDKNSRPYIKNCRGIDFNISHSGNLVICALSVPVDTSVTPKIGVDAEEISDKDRMPLAERFFAEGEKEALRIAENKAELFTEIWTKKEAYIKWLGTGLATPLSSFDTTMPLPVRFETFKMNGCFITVCAESTMFPLKIIKI